MRWRLLAHPYFTGSLVVLAVNDHLLKGRAPGALTGKLSDFAGVFLVAVLITALTHRPRFACCISGLGFVAIKTLPVATSVAAPFLGGTTLRDPTDLVSLVMLYPAYRFARRAVPNRPEHSIPRQLLTLSSATLAVFAMSATSCFRAPTVDAFVVADDGIVFARINREVVTGEGLPPPLWARSQNGGATWVSSSETPPAPASFEKEACSPSIGCFRVGDDRVEHSSQPSGDVVTSFAFSKEQRERIEQRDGCNPRDYDWFKAVTIVSRSDGDHVAVAMGTQGSLHRSPDGQWTRVAVLDRRPSSLQGPSWLLDLLLAPLAIAAVSPFVLMAGWRRRSQERGVVAFAVALVGSIVLLSFAGGLHFFGLDYVILGPLIAGLSVVLFVASVVIALAGRSTKLAPQSSPA